MLDNVFTICERFSARLWYTGRNWVLKMTDGGDCTAIVSVQDCAWPAAFVSCVASITSRDVALPLCRESDWKLSTPFLPSSEALWRQTQALLQCAITWRDVWVSWRVTYFCSPFGLPERAASCVAEHTACNVIPTDCRCKALQVSTNEALQMLSECSLLCMHVFSAPTYSKMYSRLFQMHFNVAALTHWCPWVSVLIVLRRMNVKYVDTGMFIVHVVKILRTFHHFMCQTISWSALIGNNEDSSWSQSRNRLAHTSPKHRKWTFVRFQFDTNYTKKRYDAVIYDLCSPREEAWDSQPMGQGLHKGTQNKNLMVARWWTL